ncbi:hypothetical protein RB598_008948 [Gaeumannomyces tritici]
MADSRWNAQRGVAAGGTADANGEKSSIDRTVDGENSGSDTNRWADDGVAPAGEMYDASGHRGKEGILDGPGGTTAPVTSGNIFSEGGRDYRTMGKWDATLVLITNQIGPGILALPAVVRVLGIVPATIAIIGIGMLSTYTAYELLQFYRRHPHVVNLVDMAYIVGGRPLEIVMGVSLVLDLILTCGSMSVTLSFVARIGIPSTISIVAAVFIVIISLGVGHPQNAPPEWSRVDVVMFPVGFPNFRDGMNACLNVAFAYAGNVGFVSCMAEMKDLSRDFMFAAWALQVFTIPLYIIAGVTIYVLANAIPIFDSILSIASATFIAWFTFGFAAVLWFNLFWGRDMVTGWRRTSLTVVNALIIVTTLFMNSAGLWSAAMGLQEVFDNPENNINAPFTCADNSIF